jgi:hypothetical protein
VPARPAPRRAEPAPVIPVVIALGLPGAPAPAPVAPLPALAPFADPFPVPVRALKQQRILAYNLRGEARQRALSDLAARLWQLAQDRAAQLRALGAAGDSEPVKAQRERLRRQISAHLQETVTLLEQVLEQPAAPPSARVRLAHYLRELNPRAAIPHLQVLIAKETHPARRAALRLDLAQALLQAARPAEAAALLRPAPADRASDRGLVLYVLGVGYSDDPGALAAVLPSILADAARLEGALRTMLLAHLPRLVARSGQPVALLPALVRAAGGAGAAALRAVEQCLGELMIAGQPELAVRVAAAARTLGLVVAGPLSRSLADLTGPTPGAAPPSPGRLRELLSARVAALRRCLPSAARPRVLVMDVAPGGQVRPGPGAPCADVLASWVLPGWQGPQRLRLELSILPTVGPRP